MAGMKMQGLLVVVIVAAAVVQCCWGEVATMPDKETAAKAYHDWKAHGGEAKDMSAFQKAVDAIPGKGATAEQWNEWARKTFPEEYQQANQEGIAISMDTQQKARKLAENAADVVAEKTKDTSEYASKTADSISDKLKGMF